MPVDPLVHILETERRRKVESQSENAVESAIARWMQTRGWRRTRNHVGTFKAVTGSPVMIGLEGFPDWTYTRGQSVCHVETKATGKKPRPKQREVIASLNYLGEHAWYADSLEMHIQNYSKHWSPFLNDKPYLTNR